MRSAVAQKTVQPIRNLARNPRAATQAGFSSSYSATKTTVPGGGPGGVASVRFATTAAVTAASYFAWYGNSFPEAANIVPKPTTTYRCSIWVKPDRTRTYRCNAVPYTAAGSYVAGEVYGSPTVCPANAWTRLDATITTRADTGLLQIRARDYNGTDAVAGETMEVARPLCVEGTTLPDDADGTTPGWRWTGAADLSESVGYPYTMDSLVGTAAVVAATGGVTTGPAPADAKQGRTMYVVWDRENASAAYPVVAGFGSSNSLVTAGFAALRGGQAVGTTTADSRVDTLNGGVNLVTARTSGASIGRHVGALVATDGLAQFRVAIDALSIIGRANSTADIGDGIPQGNLQLITSQGSGRGVIAYLFNREHNDETVKRVLAWLARKYPSTVANLIQNPGAEVGNLGAEGGGTGTQSRVSDLVHSGGWATRFVRTGTDTGSKGISLVYNPSGGGILSGLKASTTYRLSWWTYVESGAIPSWQVVATDYSNPRTLGGPTATGAWQRTTATFTTGATETAIRCYSLSSAATSYVVDDVMLTEGTTDWDYADGNSVGWSWDGTPGQSSSRPASIVPAGY